MSTVPASEGPIGGTILVVDDQVTYAKLVQRWLESGGHHVILAETGEKALEAVRTHEPDLVILDVMIPSPSGFEVCQQITCNAATCHIPVLMVSGLQDPTNTRRARELGAADFVTKPLQREDVLARVGHFLAQARKPKE
jgi:DNA-binding response OmpR family regulator